MPPTLFITMQALCHTVRDLDDQFSFSMLCSTHFYEKCHVKITDHSSSSCLQDFCMSPTGRYPNFQAGGFSCHQSDI